MSGLCEGPASLPSQGEVARRRLGLPRLPTGPPLPGYLLIADRDNNRIPLVSPDKRIERIVWRFPHPAGSSTARASSGPMTPS